MKYSKVLNRPMFNKHNSAYGRGIASNLVSDEERQRFNYGGRVKMQTGTNLPAIWKPNLESRIGQKLKGWGSKLWRMFPEEGLYSKAARVAPITTGVTTTAGLPLGYAYGAHKLQESLPESLQGEGGIYDQTGGWGAMGAGADITPEIDERLRRGDDPPTGKKKSDNSLLIDEALKVEKGPEGKVTEDSDVLDWTDDEKKEKMGQIQLAMAERLIGGSRDKWGSTAQMKNLAGAIGDVRKITDKSEDRAMQRKYKAYWEGKSKADQAAIRAQAKSGMNYDTLRKEVGKVRAAELVGDVKIKTFDTTKKKGNPKLKVGDVYYDVENDQFKLVEGEESVRVVGPNEIKILKEKGILDKLKGGGTAVEEVEEEKIIKEI
jgi:hypothetical protein